jgi:hypothetical protein
MRAVSQVDRLLRLFIDGRIPACFPAGGNNIVQRPAVEPLVGPIEMMNNTGLWVCPEMHLWQQNPLMMNKRIDWPSFSESGGRRVPTGKRVRRHLTHAHTINKIIANPFVVLGISSPSP